MPPDQSQHCWEVEHREPATRRFVVPPSYAGQRLDCVVSKLAAVTRSQVRGLIDRGRVWVEGQEKKAGYVVRGAEQIEMLPLLEPPTKAAPENIPLEVLYEDESLAAINKPAGMVVHPAPGRWQGTVVNALLFRWGWAGPFPDLRPGVVHRLDKDTSGVLLVAKDQYTLERLAQQFKDRLVHKTYLAVVVGRLSSTGGAISLPIGRHPSDRKKMAVQMRTGREAVSRFQVVEEFNAVSLVRLFPETGRMHQLRVHLAAVGHPIVGDRVYGYGSSRVGRALRPMVHTFPRQALHAESIRFLHPRRGKPLTIRAPYPADLIELFTALGSQKLSKSGRFLIDSSAQMQYGQTQSHGNCSDDLS